MLRRLLRSLTSRRALFGFGGLIVLSTLSGFVLSRSPSIGARPEGARLERMQADPHFADGRFANPVDTPMMENSGETLSATLDYFRGGEERVPKEPPPVAKRTADTLRPVSAEGLRITWMGHSSMLIEIDGKLVLTDPVWGPRASPFSWMGPARFHPPPIPVEDLPPLDAVLISHDHYDHLDYPTVLAMLERDVPWLVPLGVGAHLEKWGVPPERIVEMAWWEEHVIDELRLVCAPARHFSGRGMGDRNRTLWASWALITPAHRAWFSGDTGPWPEGFREIGERLGPFDATMIEVGAWHPSWGTIHLGPEAAAEAHLQVAGRTMIPVHWGTFNLALHAWDEPVITLQRVAAEKGIALGVPVVGNTVDPAAPTVDPFWQERASVQVAPGKSRAPAAAPAPASGS